jgi:hypothetical protein
MRSVGHRSVSEAGYFPPGAPPYLSLRASTGLTRVARQAGT